jgi:hypothetical protein
MGVEKWNVERNVNYSRVFFTYHPVCILLLCCHCHCPLLLLLLLHHLLLLLLCK